VAFKFLGKYEIEPPVTLIPMETVDHPSPRNNVNPLILSFHIFTMIKNENRQGMKGTSIFIPT
jgi:hypothetical protein